MNYIEFFTTDNGNGYKTKEKWVSINHPELYNNIINYISDDWFSLIPFKEKIWYFINQVPYRKKCLTCKKDLKFRNSLLSGFGDYCSIKCANKCETRIEKIKETNIEKYGGTTPMSDNVIRDKVKTTTLKNYGVDNIFKDNKYIKGKTKEKLGVEHPLQSDGIKQKFKQTNLEKYGVETPLLLSSSKVNKKNTHNQNFINKYKNLNIVNTIGDNIEIYCDKCGLDYIINRSVLWYRSNQNFNPCTICNPIKTGVSISENEIRSFLNESEIILNDRKTLKGKELDIIIPSKKIAIEYNGLFWHSDYFISNSYHLDKTEACEAKGLQLIHIFEDEWLFKKDIVKSRLLNILGLTPNKIYARKCVIKEVASKESKEFLEANHIQGNVNSSHRLGLYYNDELVSIMTFGGLRKNLGQTAKEGSFELLRFCNKLNTNVVGGASKLFKYFICNFEFEEIISYADRRWSKGDLYDKLGFEFIHNSKPNYYYVKNQIRENRFKYRKSELVKQGFDSNKTEKEIMVERGFGRIYDCGSKKYTYKKTPTL